MEPRFFCRECHEPVFSKGNEKLGLCNKCYIRWRRRPQICSVCGRLMPSYRVDEPICSDCYVKERAGKYCKQQSARFLLEEITDPVEIRLGEYWRYLERHYDEKTKPIYEAFYPIDAMFADGRLRLDMTADQVADLKRESTIRYKAALYVYMEHLSSVGQLPSREERKYRGRFIRIADTLLPGHRRLLLEYVEFCVETRQLSKWTTYLIADGVRDFLLWLEQEWGDFPLSAVSAENVEDYAHYRLAGGLAQRTVYMTLGIIHDMFRWAKMKRKVFANPAASINMRCPAERTNGLTISEQRRVLRRWLGSEASPAEAAVGILSLFYGLSTKDIVHLKVSDLSFENRTLVIRNRPFPSPLSDEVVGVLTRYLAYRTGIVGARSCSLLFPSTRSARFGHPMDPNTVPRLLEGAGVNLRALRATVLIDTALYGDLKVLEALGLSTAGTRRYALAAQGAWAGQRLLNLGDKAERGPE